MAGLVNRKVILVKRPEGMPTLDCFELVDETLPELAKDHVTMAIEHLSIDAFIRTTLNEDSFHQSVPIGGTVSALGVGRIVESRSDRFAEGDGVFSMFGAQTHVQAPAAQVLKLDEAQAPLRAYLGALGMTTGLTAYMGIRKVGGVRTGETVVVSAAAGAVGSMAAQIAKLDGGRVIGIAGGPEKVAYLLDDLGLDGAIDYKGEDVDARLRELAPDGIDVYFDNVGGELLDTVLDQIRARARVVICGAISQYQNMNAVRGPALYLRLAERQARMEGFAVDHFRQDFKEAGAQLATWLDKGDLVMREHVEKGIDRFPHALLTLFGGGHTGKLLVEI